MHDGTIHGSTVRISQKEEAYVEMVRDMIAGAGGHAWTYREGRSRTLFVVEFSRSFLGRHKPLTRADFVSYSRGFFDAEGGIPQDPTQEPYIYFAQKGTVELRALRVMLERLAIHCGKIHRPSVRADPDYWRFYVSRESHSRFVQVVGSRHPRKAPILHAMIQRHHPLSMAGVSSARLQGGAHGSS